MAKYKTESVISGNTSTSKSESTPQAPEKDQEPRSPLGKLMANPFTKAGSILVVFLIVFATAEAFLSLNADVYLVNGYESPVEITVDQGETYEVDQMQHKKITLPEGTHKFEVKGEGIENSYEAKFTANIIDRLSGKTLFVVNANPTTVLLKETTSYYTGKIPDDAVDLYEFLCGETISSDERADYMFEEFPETVEITSNRESRSRISIYGSDPILTSYAIDTYEGSASAMNYLELAIGYDPTDADVMNEYYQIAEFNDLLEEAQNFTKKLAEEENNLESHRLYQIITEDLEGIEAIQNEYAELKDAKPDNPDFIYLYARTETDPQKSIEYYQDALEIDPSHAYANFAVGSTKIDLADFTEAEKYAQKAVDANPNSDTFVAILDHALMANGKWEILVEHADDDIDEDPDNILPIMWKMAYLIAQSKNSAAREVGDDFAIEYMRNYGIDYSLYLDAWMGELVNDPDLFADELLSPDDESYLPYVHFKYLIMTEDDEGLTAFIESDPDWNPSEVEYLSLLVAARHEGDQDAEVSYKQMLLDYLSKRKNHGNEMLAMVIEKNTATKDDLTQVPGSTVKSLTALYIALDMPAGAERDEMVELAKTFNYVPSFLQDWVDDTTEKL